MTEKLEIYKCDICGNIVEMLHGGAGELVCCGEPMKLYEENTVDAAVEKHVPVLEKTNGGLKVKVGSVPHPMEEKHYIEWVQVIGGDRAYRVYLKPGGSSRPRAKSASQNGKDGRITKYVSNSVACRDSSSVSRVS